MLGFLMKICVSYLFVKVLVLYFIMLSLILNPINASGLELVVLSNIVSL